MTKRMAEICRPDHQLGKRPSAATGAIAIARDINKGAVLPFSPSWPTRVSEVAFVILEGIVFIFRDMSCIKDDPSCKTNNPLSSID